VTEPGPTAEPSAPPPAEAPAPPPAEFPAPPPAGPSGPPFVVWGDNPLALRLVETLRTEYERAVVALVRPGAHRWGRLIRELPGVEVITAEQPDRAALTAARIGQAEALAIVDQDDAANVEAALLAQELNPDLRIVIRMSKQNLGERISALLHNCTALSASAIAAPAFVAAAIGRAATPPVEVGGRTVMGIQREHARPEDVVAGLSVMGPRGTVPEVLPPDADDRADLVLARSKPAPPPRPPRTSPAGLVLSLIFGRRMRAVIGVFLVLYALGTAALFLTQPGRGIADAAYSALITALSGNPEEDVTGVARVAVVALTIVSLAFVPALTATIVDALVKLRLQREAGGLYDPVADHIVVVGLGDVGTRVVRALHNEGVAVVAIERDGARPGVQVARDLKIPVIIGNATRPETLDRASIATAQTLVVAATDDVSNLEIALLALAARPQLRVVLRLFDTDFANRVRRAFNIHTSRSVSYLAAPAFAAAMIGRAVLATIPVRRRVLLLAEIPVGERSMLHDQTVGFVTRPYESRLLAVRTADGVVWGPAPEQPLQAGDRVIVVATRVGLSRLLAESRSGARFAPDRPGFRVVDRGSGVGTAPPPPAESGPAAAGRRRSEESVLPGQRTPDDQASQPDLAEGTADDRPFGPADDGSTGPA
jgi:Trk K+ transport system NAD-binding subunit